MAIRLKRLKHWAYHVFVGADQFINAVLGGYSDETLSSRTYRKAVLNPNPKKRWRVILRTLELLFFWEKGKHCQIAFESEQARKQLPEDFRKGVDLGKNLQKGA